MEHRPAQVVLVALTRLLLRLILRQQQRPASQAEV
jgi:hypothetical protein